MSVINTTEGMYRDDSRANPWTVDVIPYIVEAATTTEEYVYFDIIITNLLDDEDPMPVPVEVTLKVTGQYDSSDMPVLKSFLAQMDPEEELSSNYSMSAVDVTAEDLTQTTFKVMVPLGFLTVKCTMDIDGVGIEGPYPLEAIINPGFGFTVTSDPIALQGRAGA